MNEQLKQHLENILSEVNSIYSLERKEPIYDKKIIDTELSVRAKNCLNSGDVFTVGDLCGLSEYELKKFPKLGWKTFSDITKFMNENKVKFGRL